MSQGNTFVLKGVIKSIGNTQKITDKFSKKAIVLDITGNSKWPRLAEIEFCNNNIDKIVGKRVGQTVSISCEIDSRLSKDGTRYFTSVRGFAVTDLIGRDEESSVPVPPPATPPSDTGSCDDDGYPF